MRLKRYAALRALHMTSCNRDTEIDLEWKAGDRARSAMSRIEYEIISVFIFFRKVYCYFMAKKATAKNSCATLVSIAPVFPEFR